MVSTTVAGQAAAINRGRHKGQITVHIVDAIVWKTTLLQETYLYNAHPIPYLPVYPNRFQPILLRKSATTTGHRLD